MLRETLNARDAAQRLNIALSTFRGWLAQSNAGTFSLQGQPITIVYRQTGAKGQGRIQIDADEVERLKAAMQVPSRVLRQRRAPITRRQFPGITVPLGRPDD